MWPFGRAARVRRALALKEEGNRLRASGALAQAEACYRSALAEDPDCLSARYNLGLASRELGQMDEAEAAFRRVLLQSPHDGDAALHLCALMAGRGAYRDALEVLAPFELQVPAATAEAFAHAWNDLGNRMQELGELAIAIRAYEAAVRALPAFAVASSNLGTALVRADRLSEAEAAFRLALTADDGLALAHANLASIHSLRGERVRALECFERALARRPNDPSLREGVLFERQNICAWDGLEDLIAAQRRSLQEEHESVPSPFSLLSIPATRDEQLLCARRYCERLESRLAPLRGQLGFRFSPGPRERLRIGYLSGDYRDHPVAVLAAELFELHDRSRFEVMAYSYGPDDGSEMRRRMVRAFDRFVDLSGHSHADAARAIHSDGIDILIDLAGHTQNARTEITALRPAPVQVNYLGYPGTMGGAGADYLVGDGFVTPASHAEGYSEAVVRLPGSYQANDRRRRIGATPSRAALDLPEKGLVFCCFNEPYKILPQVFDVWMRLLQCTPGSVLWLLERNPWAKDNLRTEARRRGVEPVRLVFAPKRPLAEHLGRLRAADLFLDTFPYNAHTVASDALWSGVPLVTCAGQTFASRVAGSLLSAVGLPDLVTHSLGEYEGKARELAHRPDELIKIRDRLAAALPSAPLFDSPAFVRSLESAYLRMWSSFMEGRGPTGFDAG